MAECAKVGGLLCYCTDAATARSQLDVVLPVLERLPELGGPPAGVQLLADLPDARFEDPECAGH
ncbi:MAG: hypothetical protein GY913_30285 [Proteobacteria bacterium]|nr:hypothetical protein [Pseudomonadota bacterium]MCP4921207.1 hypothetical protein [Pseudomonadota bacterium]